MHDIEPYYKWRQYYTAEHDEDSPFHGQTYNEFMYTQKIYNYFIHPQWDDFGSSTLYMKLLFVDYEEGIAMIELLGEWNDCLNNDIMFLKREIVDHLMRHGIYKYVVLCDNVLNFHYGKEDYYEEWYDDVKEEEGWIIFVNVLEHVLPEMEEARLQYYVEMGPHLNDINWRQETPAHALTTILTRRSQAIKQLRNA